MEYLEIIDVPASVHNGAGYFEPVQPHAVCESDYLQPDQHVTVRDTGSGNIQSMQHVVRNNDDMQSQQHNNVVYDTNNMQFQQQNNVTYDTNNLQPRRSVVSDNDENTTSEDIYDEIIDKNFIKDANQRANIQLHLTSPQAIELVRLSFFL
jgi:hypothetical protein